MESVEGDEIPKHLEESPPTPVECLNVSEESPAQLQNEQWESNETSLLAKALLQLPVTSPEVVVSVTSPEVAPVTSPEVVPVTSPDVSCDNGSVQSQSNLTILVQGATMNSEKNVDGESSNISEDLKLECTAEPQEEDIDADVVLSDPKSPEILEAMETEEPQNVEGSNDKMSAFRMQMGKAEIERMVHDGTLEKVSDRYYKVKANTIQELKTAGTPLPTNEDEAATKGVTVGPLSKKIKAMKALNLAATENEASIVVDHDEPSPNSTQILIQNVQTLTPNTSVIQQPASYIALVPVNQNQNKNTLLAVQQNPNYNPNLPTFLAVPQNISVNSSSPNSIVTDPLCASPNLTSSQIINVSGDNSVVSQPQFTASSSLENNPSVTTNHGLRPSNKAKTSSVASSTPLISGVKRKPQFEDTKVRRPHKYAKPLHSKKRNATKAKYSVSDLNSSEEEEEGEEGEKSKVKVLGKELASMFFKQIDEPKAKDKSLLDKLHNAIFGDSHLNSESESEPEKSDGEEEEEVTEILSNDDAYQMVSCPGPGKIEAFVGPGNNSKLTIIRSHETKAIKSFLYEVYRVRVTSLGREANTNILIPIPEGYKFKYPLRAREEAVEFSHLPHDDASIYNEIHPKFLDELASTQLKLRKYKDEIKVLRGRYLELLQEYANRPQFSTVSDLVGASAKFLTDDQLVFFLMQLKAGAHNMQSIRYSVREKVLALSIYQKSPEMYKWFRKLFNLPSKRILDQWLEDIGTQDPQLLKKLMYYIYTTYNYKSVS